LTQAALIMVILNTGILLFPVRQYVVQAPEWTQGLEDMAVHHVQAERTGP
jgi:hypothetical protein